MGCEAFGAGHGATMIGVAWRKKRHEGHVDNVWVKLRGLEPPNNLSAGDSGSVRNVRMVSMYAAVQ